MELHWLTPELTVTQQAPTQEAPPLGLHFFVPSAVPVTAADLKLLLSDILHDDANSYFGYRDFNKIMWGEPHYRWSNHIPVLNQLERDNAHMLGYSPAYLHPGYGPLIDPPLVSRNYPITLFSAISIMRLLNGMYKIQMDMFKQPQMMLPGFVAPWFYHLAAAFESIAREMLMFRLLKDVKVHINEEHQILKLYFEIEDFGVQPKFAIAIDQNKPFEWKTYIPIQYKQAMRVLWPHLFEELVVTTIERVKHIYLFGNVALT